MTAPTLTLGKALGLRRLANADGHFSMVALDQRPPITQLVARRRGIAEAEVAFADIVAVKRVIARAMGPLASALLLDPNYAFPAALADVPPRCGLVVTLEDHRFDDGPGGRRSHLIAHWSVAQIKRCGADGVKLLAWYRPDAAAEVCAHQQALVQAVGQQCRQHDIPFIFELLVYPFRHSAVHTTDYLESPEKQPALVLDSLREFAQPKYGVDLFKLESPLPGAHLPAPDGGPAHQQAQAWFNQIGALCRGAGTPWVMLSAGVTAAQFQRVMGYACAAGASGFLAGRALWADAMQAFPDLDRCAAVLAEQGGGTMAALTDLTRQSARPWRPDLRALQAMQAEGEVCAAYPLPAASA